MRARPTSTSRPVGNRAASRPSQVGWLKARRSSGHSPASTEMRAVRRKLAAPSQVLMSWLCPGGLMTPPIAHHRHARGPRRARVQIRDPRFANQGP